MFDMTNVESFRSIQTNWY